ncbi:hypothetical protein NP233_g13000 [Leucocoprinus birnbaumii]|uniref:Uncharacterized protein n=1 Tax=Leucocoprinus birnbaumii TaxID=56174 RepID=A0AAD5YPH5_9AGAR|nr:hypothetical protein NP233_g13000 [Leucocoprinus birnbaumii]
MVQSGELSKYPLTIVEKLLDVLGSDIGCGYDIGCSFLVSNYHQALEIILDEPTLLQEMQKENIESLKELNDIAILKAIKSKWRIVINNPTNKAQVAVDFLEETIPITTPWTKETKKYQEAASLASTIWYQHALNDLEVLVVSRLFELSKMNMSHTGYKHCKHISKALQSQSQAIKMAMEKYNIAAYAIHPPCPVLTKATVLDYIFLIVCACKEIKQLNIEIRWAITQLHDKGQYLIHQEQEFKERDPAIAYQIYCYRHDPLQFAEIHLHCFCGLSKHPRFTGCKIPSTPINKELIITASLPCALLSPEPSTKVLQEGHGFDMGLGRQYSSKNLNDTIHQSSDEQALQLSGGSEGGRNDESSRIDEGGRINEGSNGLGAYSGTKDYMDADESDDESDDENDETDDENDETAIAEAFDLLQAVVY